MSIKRKLNLRKKLSVDLGDYKMRTTKTTQKYLSLVLSLALLGSCAVGLGQEQNWVVAETKGSEDKTTEAPASQEQTTEAISSASELALSLDGMVDKRETVYVMMDADGKVDKVIVSEQLNNPRQDQELHDFSTLEDIENTSGHESFTQDGQKLTWQADGKRIDYQGRYSGDLPVQVHIHYYLDGEEKTAAEIAGQAGQVTIRFDYEILREDLLGDQSYFHPYVMVSSLALDNNHFSHIEVSNGKILDDGSKTLVVGLALPGLNENLGLDRGDFDIPSYVEITADTDAFTFSGSYSLALSGRFNALQMSTTDDVEGKIADLKLAMATLSNSSKLLVKGVDGLCTGAAQLGQGMGGLSEGLGRVQGGSDALEAGVSELQSGLAQLSANSTNLTAGMSQLEASLFTAASQQLTQELGLGEVLLTPENYGQVLDGLGAQLAQVPSPASDAAAQKLTLVRQQLESVVALTAGVQTYTAGVDASALGSQKLLQGLGSLKQGLIDLGQGAQELTKGSDKLSGGLEKLKRNLERFDQQGIDRLVNAVNNEKVADLLGNLKGVLEASEQSDLLGGKTEEMTGESKIIFKTAAIK